MIKKVIFFGQGPHAKCIHDWCKKKKLKFLFISSPRLTNQSYVKEILNLNCESLITKKISYEFLKKNYNQGTIGISAGSSFIFSKKIINLFSGNLFNIHGAPLPEYRGAASISWMILNERKKWAITIHEISSKIDSGNLLMTKSINFPKNIKMPIDYRNFLWKKELQVLKEFLNKVNSSKKLDFTIQNEKNSCYYPRLSAEKNGWINFLWKSKQIERFIYAFSHDYAGARSYIKNKLIIIYSLKKHIKKKENHPYLCGIIFKIVNNNLYTHTIDGYLIINDFSCKAHIKAGDRIYTPIEKLENSMTDRVFYKP